jgi:tRNA-specific 2-thiouridylase
VGQRKGLGIASQRRLFVVRMDPKRATVHLGPEDALRASGAELAAVSLADGVSLPLRASVRIRYRHEGAAALIVSSANHGARVLFDRPERAVTPGQAAVFYDGVRVVGGGRIASSLAASANP